MTLRLSCGKQIGHGRSKRRRTGARGRGRGEIMKKGISQLCFPDEMGIEDVLSISKKAGFQGVELMVKEEGELSLESSERDIAAIGKIAGDAGIELASLVTLIPWECPLTSADAGLRARGMRSIEKTLEAASILGADTILVVPGVVGCDFSPGVEVVPYDVAYERAVESVRKLCAAAERLKVNLGIENVWNKFLLSPLEFRSFLDEVSHARAVAYFDVGNVLAFGYPEHWIPVLGERIKKVHIKDFKRSIGNIQGFVPLLQGDIDWKAVMAALGKIGYDDYLLAEIAPYPSFPLKAIQDISTSMDEILKL